MSIDRSILSEFIKATNDNKETKQTQLYGTVVTQGNSKCVKIDGSEIVTPVRSITDIKDDERVMVSIKDHMATVTGNMTNPSVGNDRVESAEGKIDRFDHLFAGNITAENIAAGSITADKILAGAITTDKLMAESIIADKIAANAIESKHIKADTIESGHIKSNTIESDHIKAGVINAEHITSESITADKIQSGSITAGSGIIADGAIGNAQISKIDAAKIEAGTIDTSKVTIQGSNGHLRLKGNRMQVFDGVGNQAKERVSVGDVNGDGSIFGLRVRGADGQTLLLDENGVKSEGITDGSITNDKISEDANIDGAKININSVVSKINEDGTETIQGTKIEVNGTTLNTKLSNITIKQTEDSERISQAQSQINANTNAIKLKVDEQTYTSDKKDMTSKLEKNTSEISMLKGQISLKVEQTDIENAINEATLSRADFIARNFLSTPLIVSDSTLPIYTLSGIPNPPIGSVFGGFSQEKNIIKNNNISSNGSAWAIIVGYEFYKNTTDNDKKNKIRDIIKKVADFMANNVSIGRFNSMDFNFIDTNYKYDSTSKSWVKSNYKEIYLSTLWLQVKAMVYAYEILKDNTYSSLCFNILDSLFNTHFYINTKVESNELPTHLEWSSYEYLTCDNLSTNYRFVASTKQYSNQMGYYIHQAIPDVIRVFGDNERPTPKGDIYKPSDILVGLKKYLKNAYDTQNITAKPLGLPYGYFHRVENGSGGYDYIPQNWNFIEDTWGDGWFVGDVVTYTIYAFAASGLTDIAREYADNYYKLRVNVNDDKWSTRFNASELIFYDRMDFYTGSHLSDDNSISITYTALYYEILKQIGKNEHIDACCYTLAKHQINNLDNKNIDGGYPWDISRDDSSLEFKSFGEIINSQFYKNLNITSFTAIDNKFAEIKVTTDSISQNVTNLSQTVSTKADGSTVTTLSSKVGSLETSVNGITSRVGEVETNQTSINGQVTGLESRMSDAESKITKSAITNVVKESQFIKDINGNITTNKNNISKMEQTSNSITSSVKDLEGKYTEIKQTVDGIDLTGKVSFSDLSTSGRTTINGANITTGTIDTNKVNIKGNTTRKIVIANDNYCVYDGAETDVNRKVFMGFRPYNSNAQYIPSVMLGYNGINPNVDGAVVSGGTYTTYSHYPNNNNPESINLSYGALAFKYGASGTQFSTINLYQNGDIDLKAGKSIYFRPNLRAKNNHVFAISDVDVGCRVPFKCTSTIFTNGDITTDRNIHAYGNISASGSMSCGTILPNNISIGSGLSINSNGIYTTGHITGNMVKTDSYRFTNNHIAFGKSDYNNNMMNGCNWDWQYYNLVNVKVYPVSLSLPTIDEPAIQTVRETQKDTLSQIKFQEARELSVEESAPSIDISDVTNKEEITTNGDVDLIKLVYLLVKDVQTLKQENEIIKSELKELQSK